jgi:acyl-CoA thioesterase I
MKEKKQKPIAVCVFLVLLCSVLACSQKEAKLSQLPPGAVVLAFGDSLTFGTGAPTGQSYPDVLEKLIRIKVINSGVPGETSEQGMARLPQALAVSRPNLVILCHGGNDILRKLDPEKTAANLAEMIRAARKQGAEVVLIGVPKPGVLPETAGFYRTVARKMDIPLEEDVVLGILKDGALKSDHIHPNAAGYARMASAVEKLLKKSGAVQ